MTVAVCGLLAGVPAGAGDPRAAPPARALPHLDWRPSPGASSGAGTPSGLNRITTDTLDYCAHLAAMYEKVRQSGGYVDPADDLMAREGWTLCRGGELRMGIHALRRALVGFDAPP